MARKKSGTTGTASIVKFLNKVEGSVAAGVHSASEDAAYKIAKEIYDISQTLVPVKTGALKSSGAISEKNGNYYVHYGSGLPRHYAFYVHENMRHNEPHESQGSAPYGATGNLKEYTTPGTGPKYLEQAAYMAANKERVVKQLRDSLGRFVTKKQPK